MATTLRDWLQILDDNALLHRVREEVSIESLASIVDQNIRQATLFERIKGYSMPVAVNTFSNRKILALALGTDEEHVGEALAARRGVYVKPKNISTAPCQDVVIEGDDVNLGDFPIHLQHELDAAPYITAGVVVAKDPERGVSNMGVYRMMYRTRNQTGVDVTAPHKLRRYYQQSLEHGKPLEIAVVLGLPAIDIIGALDSASPEIDEFDVLGGFRGEAVELVQCKSVDLQVPANAEMVLEGEMLPIGWTADEGPYGEFTGTYGAGLKRNPIIKIKVISHKRDAVFLSATHGGVHPGWTDMHVMFPLFEVDMCAAMRQAGIDVRAIRSLPASSGMWGVASIKPHHKGDAKAALALMLAGSKQGFPKIAVVVDEDIDIFDDDQVHWAMTWRAQPSEDIMVLNDMKAIPLDPSLPSSMPPVSTSKLGWDATIPIGRDRAQFEICHPTRFEPARGDRESTKGEELDEKILALIADRPRYFKEIMTALDGIPQKAIVESFGRLRERDLFARDDATRYILKP